MPTYNNIGGMVPQGTLGYKSPTMGGALLGMQLGYQRADAERGFAADDLTMATMKRKLQQAELDDPMLAAEREAKIAEAGTTTQWNKEGGALETKQQALMNAQLQGKKASGDLDDAEKTRQKKAIIDIVGALEEAGPLDQNKPGDKALWDDLKSNSPVPMPSWPTPQWLKGAQAKRDSYVNDLEHRQKTKLETFKTDETIRATDASQAGAAAIAAERDARLFPHEIEKAKLGNLSRETTATIRAEATNPKTAEATAMKYLNEGNYVQLAKMLDVLFNIEAKGRPMMTLWDEDKRDEWKDKKMKELQVGEPTSQAAPKTASTAAPKAAGAPKKVSSQAEYDALPTGAEYIDPKGRKLVKR